MYCCAAANSLATCSLRAATKRSEGMRAKLSAGLPPEPGRRDPRLERRRRQPRGRLRQVVVRRRHVVRRVRMEEGGQVLDVAAAHAQLELTAAVRADAVLVAVVVGVEELAQAAEAR